MTLTVDKKTKEFLIDTGRTLFPKCPAALRDKKRMVKLSNVVSIYLAQDGVILDAKLINELWQKEFSFLLED